MSRRLLVVALVALTLVAPSVSFALPLLYTFEGTVTLSTNSKVGLVVPALGSKVSYSFLVDTSEPGGVTVAGVFVPSSDTPGIDYFYAQYVSGEAVVPNWGSVSTEYDTVGENHLAGRGFLIGSANDTYRNYLQISNTVVAFSMWAVGTTVSGDNQGLDLAGGDFRVFSELSLVSIEGPGPAVPEPSGLSVLGAGLLILGIKKAHRSRA